jgi:hypothetical protein
MSYIDPRTTAEEQLKIDIGDTLLAGHSYPIESRSDLDACVRALLRMYDVTRRPLVPKDPPPERGHYTFTEEEIEIERQKMLADLKAGNHE